ncbi:MAG: lysophospholipid acyltransferase family protein [Acidobacteriota bacterium]
MSFKSARWAVEFAAVQSLAHLVSRLTPATRRSLGRALGSAVYLLDARHRRVALHNLERALPALSSRERRAVARGAFSHLGRLLVEILEHKEPPTALLGRCRFEGLEHLRAAAEAGRGYFLVSAHFGNWERVALLQAALGYPLWMITRPLDNPRLEAFLARRRESTGNRVIHKRRAVREMVKGLREGRGIALVIDQNFGEPGRVFVPFFGRPAATTPVLGSLAVRTGAAVLPVFAFPEEGGWYRIVYGPPIEAPSTGDPEADAISVTAAATARIEEAVRACPGAWFWMHRRWRTRPDGPDDGP